MTTVTPKKSQKTEFVVRAGSRAVYRGDSAAEARSVARAFGERASTTFRSEEAVAAYLSHRA